MEKIHLLHYSTIISYVFSCKEKKMSVQLVLIIIQEMSIIKNELEENYTHCKNERSSQDALNFGIHSVL